MEYLCYVLGIGGVGGGVGFGGGVGVVVDYGGDFVY